MTADEELLGRLCEVMPESTIEVCKVLSQAGFEAWAVGGAVRDVILGRLPGDWDVTTNALPETVVKLFEKTIPTGLQHGTVTVMAGRGAKREAIEVTTFRGEGAYSDSRRPDTVYFGVGLEEDLRRRDFVINAIAFDPIHRKIFDPFGGREDIRNRRIRAVGVPEERFAEDGLRVMRAVRFVSVMDFDLDGATEEGIISERSSLESVAPERVRVELLKLLGGSACKKALQIAERVGILRIILPEISQLDFSAALDRVQLCPPDPILRLAALLWGLEPKAAELCLRRLTASNDERKRVVRLLTHVPRFGLELAGSELRQHLSLVGRKNLAEHLALATAEAERLHTGLAHIERARAVMEAGDALAISELKIGGRDLMQIGISGRALGDVLEHLLSLVLEDPAKNRAELLLTAAKAWVEDAS